MSPLNNDSGNFQAPPAAWWTPLPDNKVSCQLCPLQCTLKINQHGPCETRFNSEGQMKPLHYGQIVAAATDPIEKKPLYHFHPGSFITSVAAPGCNLHCRFCQNHNISQGKNAGRNTESVSVQDVIDVAFQDNSVGIAFTYSEPLVWFEFVRDCAAEAKQKGLKTVLVTNGFLNPEPLAEILPFIDAANIDLKAMDNDFYRKICKAELQPVLKAIRQFHDAGVHLELTNLLIPGHNDSPEEIDKLVDFIADLNPQIPLHFSAYHPAWKMQAPATPVSTMKRVREQAAVKLPWVYLGNVPGETGRDTLCPQCNLTAILRTGFKAKVNLAAEAHCPGCGFNFPIVS
ncbi:MAG: AmmeMemoRadiSam system radical SAM enzyme [bacterium]|nr:AmmeMemoRadiSam system radical SAM enzyme [bacterium]